MPGKRKDTEKVSFFIPKDVKKQLDEYVNANYSATDGYGAYSSVATQALSYFCSTADMKTSGPINDDFIRVDLKDFARGAYEEAKAKAEYEAECAAAQSLTDKENEERWEEEQAEDERREAESRGPEGEEG